MNKNKMSVKNIIIAGVGAAIVVAATFIKVPFGSGAMVHLGSGAIFTLSMLFGPVAGGFAGAIGSAIFDLLMGFSVYTVPSFFIKGTAGLLGGFVFAKTNRLNLLVRIILSCIFGAAINLVGYFMAWYVILGAGAAYANIPASLMTSAAGTILTILLVPALRVGMKGAGLSRD